MKRILSIILLFISITATAQTYYKSILEYNWENTITEYKPTAKEQAYSSLMLFSKEFYQYFPDKEAGLSKVRCMHNSILINDEKAIEDNNKLYFGIEDRSSIKELKVRVIEKGKVISTMGVADMKTVSEDGKDYLIMAITGLKKGVILETILILQQSLDLYGTYYIQKNFPIKSFEFQVVSPSHLLFKAKVYNGLDSQTDTTIDELNYITIKQTDIPKYQKELNALEHANKVRIEYTYFKNQASNTFYSKFSETAKRYSENIFSEYSSMEKHIVKALKKLNLDQLSEEEKVFQIENYIKTSFELKRGMANTSVDEVIKNKYGNSYSLDRLMLYLLKYSNVKFELVITCSREDKYFDENFQSLTFFDNTLYYFPTLNKYLDTDYRLARIGKIGTEYLGQNSIHVKFMEVGGVLTGIAYFKVIPKNSELDGTSVDNYNVSFDPNTNKVKVLSSREMFGYADQNLKGAYFIQNEEERKEMMEGFVKGMSKESDVTNIKVSNYNLTNYSESKSPLVITSQIDSKDFIEEAGDKLIFNIGEIIGLQQELYDSIPRQNPVDLDFIHIYKRKIEFVIPEGYKCTGLDKINMNNVFKDQNGNESLGFTSKYELKNNVLTIYCDEYYKELYYPLPYYESYRKVLNSAADFNKISILIQKN